MDYEVDTVNLRDQSTKPWKRLVQAEMKNVKMQRKMLWSAVNGDKTD